MCGIAGYIGNSKNPKTTYDLITGLFDNLELRGLDASGIWGTESGKNGSVIYHKEPIRSSEFVKSPIWKRVRKLKPDLLLVHARYTSKGNGHASFNVNNHPFVSADKRIGMIHNGTIQEAEFLKKKYEIKSSTDSEVLLRMYEDGIESKLKKIDDVPDHVAQRMNGIRDIWSVVSRGAMSVAVGERINEHRRSLILFHNAQRPLWLADLRELLGQIFFFSCPTIWYRAISDNNSLKKAITTTQKLIEVPVKQIWHFEIDEDNLMIGENNHIKLDVDITTRSSEWKPGEEKTKIQAKKQELSVISQLDELDGIKTKPVKKIPINHYPPTPSTTPINHYPPTPSNKPPKEAVPFDPFSGGSGFSDLSDQVHQQLTEDISKILDDIDIELTGLCNEGSVNINDYQSILSYLEDIKKDMRGTLSIVQAR